MKILNKICYIVAVIICIAMFNNIYGATIIKSTSYAPKVGNRITVKINVSDVATWQINVSYDSAYLKKISGSTILDRESGVTNVTNFTAGTLVFEARKAGTTTISTSGNSYNADAETVEDRISVVASKSITISNPAPVVTPTVTTNSNAYLKKMSVNVEGLNPMFSKSRTSYSLTVKENVSSINVYATTEDSKATYSISGNKNLAVGDNTIRVVVTASDRKTKKTYTINVTKSNNPELMDATLKSLIIEDITLDPEFDSGVTAYTCPEIDSKVESLNILAVPTNENAKVAITGNTALKAGVNTIVIKVTSAGGTIAKSYTLTVNKKQGPVVDIYGENNNPAPTTDETSEVSNLEKLENMISKFLKENWLSVSLGLLCVLEAICILCLGLKLRKVNKANKPIIQEVINEEKTKRRGNNIIEEISQETIAEEEPLEIKDESLLENENNIEEQPADDQIDEDTEE